MRTHTHTHTHTHTQSNYGNVNLTQLTHTSASAHTQLHQLSCLDKEIGFQWRSERLNGILLLDGHREDIPRLILCKPKPKPYVVCEWHTMGMTQWIWIWIQRVWDTMGSLSLPPSPAHPLPCPSPSPPYFYFHCEFHLLVFLPPGCGSWKEQEGEEVRQEEEEEGKEVGKEKEGEERKGLDTWQVSEWLAASYSIAGWASNFGFAYLWL